MSKQKKGNTVLCAEIILGRISVRKQKRAHYTFGICTPKLCVFPVFFPTVVLKDCGTFGPLGVQLRYPCLFKKEVPPRLWNRGRQSAPYPSFYVCGTLLRQCVQDKWISGLESGFGSVICLIEGRGPVTCLLIFQ